MYQYKNTRTGSIIRTHGKLAGGGWELMGTAKQAANQEKEQPTETAAAPAAETPAAKPADTKPAAKTTTKKAASTRTKPAAKGKAK